MWSRFLGQSLLERGRIKRDQLLDAVKLSYQLRTKLGGLAVIRGYMTEEQASRVQQLQRFQDKKFGELAVEEGFLTPDQVAELLDHQKQDCMMLGEALVQRGYLTGDELAEELKALETNWDDAPEGVSRLYKDEPNGPILEAFADVVLKMFVRMADDAGFWPQPCHHDIQAVQPYDYTVSQSIHGAFYGAFCLSMTSNILKRVAEAMIGMPLDEVDELVLDGAAEFVNIIDGNVCSRLAPEGENVVIAPPRVCDNTAGRPFELKEEAADGLLTIIPLLHAEGGAEIWVIDRSVE